MDKLVDIFLYFYQQFQLLFCFYWVQSNRNTFWSWSNQQLW